MSKLARKKIAIVCDWLDTVGGAEQVLLEVHKMFKKAPIYTSIYRPKRVDWFRNADVRTGWLNHLPAYLRKFTPFLRNLYFSRLKLDEYDLIISVTGAEAKAVRRREGAVHVCYMHAPTQYYWQKYREYLKEPGFGVFDPLARLGLRVLVRSLRRADKRFALRPDYIVTTSRYEKKEVMKYYKREADVISPPVAVEAFMGGKKKRKKREGFAVTSRQVPWKRLDLAVEACINANEKLTVVGNGSEHKRLIKLAREYEDLIEFLPVQDQAGVKAVLERSKGYIFPSFEPFGIAPVEALATGTPVIAFKKGGARDYIVEGKNGLLFGKQDVQSLADAIEKFKGMKFSSRVVASSAKKFSRERFRKEFKSYLERVI